MTGALKMVGCPTADEEIAGALRLLVLHMLPGSDLIHLEAVEELAKQVIPALLGRFNGFLEQGQLSKLAPVFFQGDNRSQTTN